MNKPTEYWYRCPVCGYHHMIKYRSDTVLKNFPAYCKGCKQQVLITIEPKSQIVSH